MLIKNKKGSAISFVIIITVFVIVSWFVFITLWPLTEPFLSSLNADPVTTFFLFIIPIFLVLSIPFMFILGGMGL